MITYAKLFLVLIVVLLTGSAALAEPLCAESLGKDSAILQSLNFKKIGPTTWDGRVENTYVQVECVNDLIARVSYFYASSPAVPSITLGNAIVKHGNFQLPIKEYMELPCSGDNFCPYDKSAHVLYHSVKNSMKGIEASCNRIDYVSDSLLALDPMGNSPTPISVSTKDELNLAFRHVTAWPVECEPSKVIYVDEKHKVVEIRFKNSDFKRTLVWAKTTFAYETSLKHQALASSEQSVNVTPGSDFMWIVPVSNNAVANGTVKLVKQSFKLSDGTLH